MHFLRILLVLTLSCQLVRAAQEDVADATVPEHVQSLIAELDHPQFQRRELAAKSLTGQGVVVIPGLARAAESGSPEASVRAFDVLQKLYNGEDEATFEAVEQVFQRLKVDEHLAVASRAERAFDTGSETRQKRAIAKFEKLGGIVHFSERPSSERLALGRPTIEYVMLGRDWTGGEEGLRLLGRIEDLRTSITQLYIIRGINISEETKLDLLAELPFLKIEHRGPARLGIRGSHLNDGCIVIGIDPGSAAELAGMKIRDEVIEIDDRPVESFEDLIGIIGEKEPGEQVPIVFRRGEETRRVVAKLSGWTRPARPNAPLQQP
ncbi:PDZ domain-containing protein [Schlesneria sp. DSM 10557]|uniref:PDZ domain-containing protein n=1 Tax=Schlesneria sp. DSM 10557 TaxID=3044399 RepID=UPI0035A082C4